MLTNLRRGQRLSIAGAVGILLSALMLIFARGQAPQPAPRQAAHEVPAASRPQTPAALPAAANRRHYIVQSVSADAARQAVQAAGGDVSSDLGVIRAVAAALDERELTALRAATAAACRSTTMRR